MLLAIGRWLLQLTGTAAVVLLAVGIGKFFYSYRADRLTEPE